MLKVSAYLNDTYGGSFRKGLNPESDARFDAAVSYDSVKSDPDDGTLKGVMGGNTSLVFSTDGRAAVPEYNPLDSPMWRGYQDGDVLVKSEVELFLAAPDHEAAAEMAFARLNRDDRPNGPRERSLSVGDVVEVEENGVVTCFAVERAGFRTLSEEVPRGSA